MQTQTVVGVIRDGDWVISQCMASGGCKPAHHDGSMAWFIIAVLIILMLGGKERRTS